MVVRVRRVRVAVAAATVLGQKQMQHGQQVSIYTAVRQAFARFRPVASLGRCGRSYDQQRSRKSVDYGLMHLGSVSGSAF